MAIKPKHLIVNLLLAAKSPVSTQILVGVCELFGITANNARVTLARLTAEQMLQTSGRGFYQLGDGALGLAEEMSHWRNLEDRVCSWQGDWIGVYIGALGRTDRTGLRRRLRVLKLAGFEALEKDLWIRPNNLEGGIELLRPRLYRLGLESQARVMGLGGFSNAEQQQAIELWDVEALVVQYQEETQEMRQWIAGADQLETEEAARQSFLMGDRVLRHIAYDPLLPPQMVDVNLRIQYVEMMSRYDRVGNGFFEEIYRNLGIVS